MSDVEIKFAAYDKAIPPRPIRIKVPGWGGGSQKMVDGSEPQPWHCLPFNEGATYNLELVYPYETECHVINENGEVRFEWEYWKEPDSSLNGGEFVTFYPKVPSKFYLFNTSLDLQAPPGHVIATHPHPRFFTDDTGAVPIALPGHVQTEWWPKKFFVVFKSPPRGQRHIFRKGEAYAAISVVPQRVSHELAAMTSLEESNRRALERDILLSAKEIAGNVWSNPSGYAFSNHYKVLAATFAREGQAGVDRAVREAVARQQGELPKDRPIAQCMELAMQHFREQRFTEAKALYVHILNRDPDNADAVNRLGVIAACEGMPLVALKLMTQSIALSGDSSLYHLDLGELYRRMGRFGEAEEALRTAMHLDPVNAQAASMLALVLDQQGRTSEATAACRDALALYPTAPLPYHLMGSLMARQGQPDQARAYFQAALSLDQNCEEAKRGLTALTIEFQRNPKPPV